MKFKELFEQFDIGEFEQSMGIGNESDNEVATNDSTDEPTPETNITDETPLEQTTGEDYTILSYDEKIKMVIALLKEFGFSNIDYKIDDNKNNVLVRGNLEDADKTTIEDLANKLDIEITTEVKQIEGGSNLTILKFANNLDINKFLNVYNKSTNK